MVKRRIAWHKEAVQANNKDDASRLENMLLFNYICNRDFLLGVQDDPIIQEFVGVTEAKYQQLNLTI